MSDVHPRTRAQLRALGWSDTAISGRLRRQHSWVATHRGVVVPVGVPLDLKTRVLAARAAVGPASVVGGLDAARLWGFEGLPDGEVNGANTVGLWVPPHVNAESRAGI